jgi:Tfp pilus assembly protein FimT
MRRGFSLVECVVACVLCAIGLLALAGASRGMLDLASLGHRTAVAAEVAAARLAVLRVSACGSGGSGEAIAGAYAERWSLAGAGPSRAASVQVTFAVGGRPHTIRYEAVFACLA